MIVRSAGAAVGAAARMVTRRGAAPGGVVLAYHDVDPNRESSGWTVGAAALESHILLLRRLGLEVVELVTIVKRLESGRPVDGMAALTFDDALVGVHDHGLNVLLDNGAPATVFVVSGTLGARPPWWPESRRTMTADELTRLRSLGFTIGSHTRSHASLPSLASSDLVEELAGARDDLESVFGPGVDLLAYPSGHHDPDVRRAVEAAGYRAAFTFLNGRVRSGDDILRLPRLTMGAHMTPRRLSYHLMRPARSWPDHQIDRVEADE